MQHLRRALGDIRQNGFLNSITVITIALAVMIVSAFSLFILNVGDIIHSWKQGVRVMAYLQDDLPETKIHQLQQQIEGMYGVQQIEYISKEAALKRLRNQMKRQASLLANLKENPLPCAFRIRVGPSAGGEDAAEILARAVESLPEVVEVEYGQQWVGKLTNIYHLFRLAGIALGSLFFLAAVFIVANTIRLVLYSRQEEVDIMRLVGATDRFIRTPLYIEGLVLGALGGLIGLAILLAMYLLIASNVELAITGGMLQIRFLPLPAVGGILVSSMAVGWLGCFLSLRQFLKP